MRDKEGIEITQYVDGYYWIEDDKYGLFLIQIQDDEILCFGDEQSSSLEKWDGQIIEEVTEPII